MRRRENLENFSLCQRDLNDALTSGSQRCQGLLWSPLPSFGRVEHPSLHCKFLLWWPGICDDAVGKASEKKEE